jgi:Transposase DDE domain
MTTTIRVPAIVWDDATARGQLVDALVSDAHRLLGHLPDQDLGPRAAEAVALLALIAGQDVEPVEGSDGHWRIAQNVASDRVISTVDPDTRHVHKTVHRRQDGYKAHLAVEPDTGIITDCALTQANGAANHEAAVGLSLLEGEQGPLTVLGDSGLWHRRIPRSTDDTSTHRPGQTRTDTQRHPGRVHR